MTFTCINELELEIMFPKANIPWNALATEFSNFLLEKWHIVKDLNESQFITFIINETDEDYTHLVRYDILVLVAC